VYFVFSPPMFPIYFEKHAHTFARFSFHTEAPIYLLFVCFGSFSFSLSLAL
jgi:hypothetical protein